MDYLRNAFYSLGFGGVGESELNLTPGNAASNTTPEVEEEEFAFLWSIRNYSVMKNLEEVKSPVFPGGNKHDWQLRINPEKMIDGNKYFGLYLTLVKFGDEDNTEFRKISAQIEVTLLDITASAGFQRRSRTIEFQKNSTCGNGKLLLSSNLLNGPVTFIREMDDTLNIHVRIWIQKEIKHQSAHCAGPNRTVEEIARSHRRQEEFSLDLGKFLKQGGTDSDIEIKTETATFQVHKVVLAARCPIFAAMLEEARKEKKPLKDIFIGGFQNDVVQGMLDYLYTGEIQLLQENLMGLLEIADKYQLVELKDDCKTALIAKLTDGNAVDTLVSAHLHNAGELKNEVIKYINSRRKFFKENENFKKALNTHPNLAVELFMAEEHMDTT
ncbi:unnamed protein product [Orchesella dallaii]|uniref:Protein roadkill n=1 Tax=Orchesella dallaii TaxID=48710 RepID=A0ABP1R1Z1_9HEXA